MKLLSVLPALILVPLLSSCSIIDKRSDAKPDIEQKARDILSAMSLEEKIGQILQGDISAVTPDDLRKYNLGSVLNGGNSAPGGEKTAPASDWIALADAYWNASTDTADGGVGIPALWGTDAVHGHSNLTEATIFPHNIGLGAARDPKLLREIGRITAIEVRASGLDWTFAPTLAVAQDARWGRYYESYASDPALVADYARAMVEGIQGKPGTDAFLADNHIIATAKHFLGDGGTQGGVDRGDTRMDIDTLLEIHGAGYDTALTADVQTVMASFSSVNGRRMHGRKDLMTDWLKHEQNFEGFIIGDWNGHADIHGCTATDCVAALHAGLDMFMAPDSWKGLYHSLLRHARTGELDLARLDDAVLRILKVKLLSGLFEAGPPSTRPTTNVSALGHAEHRAVAREAVRKSLVLLKNRNILPIQAQGAHIMVAGSGADSMQMQTGGWTLSWQGDNNQNDEFSVGETIFSGIRKAVEQAGGSAALVPDGNYVQRPDIAILVYGEPPYAEFRGDRPDLVYEFSDGANLALAKRMRSEGIRVVTLFLSGRPMWVNPHLNASDAFVAAWLPGSEAGGVADVLIADAKGQVRYDFTGRLPFPWPIKGDGKPATDSNKGDFLPLGLGLTYSDTIAPFGTLPEDPGIEAHRAFAGDIITKGDAGPSLTFYLGDATDANMPAQGLAHTSAGGVLQTRGVDRYAQEDSRQITWLKDSLANVSVRSRHPVDLSELPEPETLTLHLEWRIDQHPDQPLLLAMECGTGCAGVLDVSPLISTLPEGEWNQTRIPLQCFKGLNPSSVTSLLRLTGTSKTRLSLHSARIDSMDEVPTACPGD